MDRFVGPILNSEQEIPEGWAVCDRSAGGHAHYPRAAHRVRPCLDAVKAKRKIFVNRLYGVLNVVKK